MISERQRALERKYPSPIHETIEDTHRNYDRAVELSLESISKGDRLEVLVASHNQVMICIYVCMHHWMDTRILICSPSISLTMFSRNPMGTTKTQRSVEKALAKMQELGLKKTSGVYFGQVRRGRLYLRVLNSACQPLIYVSGSMLLFFQLAPYSVISDSLLLLLLLLFLLLLADTVSLY